MTITVINFIFVYFPGRIRVDGPVGLPVVKLVQRKAPPQIMLLEIIR